ncbi:MAG: phospho-N-acetylmuramoyl-pentapeptide-transferase [Balneolaceae bacterium]|nr:phospho-N-acetylmuramoyl-pentapeptide-transferase [Balneolaceae bacterium]
MLHEFFVWLDTVYDFPGAGAVNFITTRTALAAVTSLLISIFIGRRIIHWLSKLQLQETIREDIGLDHHLVKGSTPTMGGAIILLSVIIPSILWTKLDSIYGWLIVFVMLALGIVGFIDDYIKVVKKNKTGLAGRFKIVGQVTVGLITGLILYFHPSFEAVNTLSTVPFLKNVNIDYAYFGEEVGWIIYLGVAVFIITAVSNATNLTDGLDGLASGISVICGVVFAIYAYISGRVDTSAYLDIMYLEGAGELTIFCAALIGACIGFLWYNTNPASVFMGDTGSLALGGAFGALGLMLHKELLLPFICGVFFFETLSVIIQTTYFKYTKKRYGEGKRVFLMTPIHHHYEKKGWPEQKIVVRFWIIAILMGIISLLTLKIR